MAMFSDWLRLYIWIVKKRKARPKETTIKRSTPVVGLLCPLAEPKKLSIKTMHVRPLFSYMGSKWNLAKRYGPPRFKTVIEPFAGSAAYSLYWSAPEVILYDLNPVIVGIWKYLISVSESEILKLPLDFESLDDEKIPQEARHLIGFWCGKSRTTPAKRRSAWGRQYRNDHRCRVWGEAVRRRVASNLRFIRKWQIHELSFEKIPNQEAHWFIDPPYEKQGKHYPFSKIDYAACAEFCRSRLGFVQVCENDGANWLPFQPFHRARGTYGKHRTGTSLESLFQIGQIQQQSLLIPTL